MIRRFETKKQNDTSDGDERFEEDLEHALDWTNEPQPARDALERYRLKRALKETNGTVTDVARIWEVTDRAVYKMCYKHNLKPDQFRDE